MNNKINIIIISFLAVILSLTSSVAKFCNAQDYDTISPPENFQPIQSVEYFGGSSALLIQDVIPWGSDSNRGALDEFGISYSLINSSTLYSLDYEDLKGYKFIIYS